MATVFTFTMGKTLKCVIILQLVLAGLCTSLVENEPLAEHGIPESSDRPAEQLPAAEPPNVDTNDTASLDVVAEPPVLVQQNTSSGNTSAVPTATKRFTCLTEYVAADVTLQLLNASVLQTELVSNPNVTNRSQAARCQMVFFYAPWCPYSIKAAPHINALPRHFPAITFYGINAYKHVSLNSMYGVMAVPALFLFHNGKPAARYNDSEYKLEQMAAFIAQYTGIEPSAPLVRISADYKGPLPTTLVEETDPWLFIAWIFVVLSIVYWFAKSSLCSTLIENLQNTWREAAAQHEHTD